MVKGGNVRSPGPWMPAFAGMTDVTHYRLVS
jgi:hypothetical protein